jgi:photosystem II stability/assembly factor-like uncharacterized protein
MLKHTLTCFLITGAASFTSALDRGFHRPTFTPQKSGTNQLLISVSPVNSRVVWAAETEGTYVVTTDGGATWKAAVVPGAENLQFRDVEGVSDKDFNGSAAWSPDEGHTWFGLPQISGFWGVAFATPNAGWFVGTGGQIIKISF